MRAQSPGPLTREGRRHAPQRVAGVEEGVKQVLIIDWRWRQEVLGTSLEALFPSLILRVQFMLTVVRVAAVKDSPRDRDGCVDQSQIQSVFGPPPNV